MWNVDDVKCVGFVLQYRLSAMVQRREQERGE